MNDKSKEQLIDVFLSYRHIYKTVHTSEGEQGFLDRSKTAV